MAWPAVIAAIASALQTGAQGAASKEDLRQKAIEGSKARRERAQQMTIETAKRYGEGQQSAISNLINALQRASIR